MWIKNIGIGDPGGKPPIPTAEIAPTHLCWWWNM